MGGGRDGDKEEEKEKGSVEGAQLGQLGAGGAIYHKGEAWGWGWAWEEGGAEIKNSSLLRCLRDIQVEMCSRW